MGDRSYRAVRRSDVCPAGAPRESAGRRVRVLECESAAVLVDCQSAAASCSARCAIYWLQRAVRSWMYIARHARYWTIDASELARQCKEAGCFPAASLAEPCMGPPPSRVTLRHSSSPAVPCSELRRTISSCLSSFNQGRETPTSHSEPTARLVTVAPALAACKRIWTAVRWPLDVRRSSHALAARRPSLPVVLADLVHQHSDT